MPPTVTKITFPNNREATAVFPLAGTTGAEIVGALGVRDYKAVILLIGGADSVAENVKARLTQLFGRGIARAAASVNAVVVDGGTAAGVMQMMGQGVADRGYKSSLIGVAPLALVNFPGSEGGGETPLDPNHSHFVLVEGNEWGNETGVIYKLVSALTSNKTPVVVLLVGGGAVSKNEALQAVRQSLPLFVVEGSGGLADEIATAWKARPELPDDPVMAEIIADGRIEFHQLNGPVEGAQRLILRELGGDNVLLQAWERFADYDLTAIEQQHRFNWIQGIILTIGVLATALALIKEVWGPKDDVLPRYSSWWFIYYVLIVFPIALTVLITAASRFKQGHKWLLLRAAAEAIKREIYRYRARAGDYKEVFTVVPQTPPAPGTTPPPPPPTPDQVLAQRVEDITRRVMRTEVNSSSLLPYDKSLGFPPNMGSDVGDDGFSVLTPDRYVQVRLGDQLNYYRSKAVKHEQRLRVLQWSIFIIGGLGTLLAAINQQVWIALTTALAAALTTYLGYKGIENTLMKYNQAATDLENVKSWWTALPAEDQANQENVTTLVNHTEQVLQSELDGWVQQMQNALAELRKGQEKAPDRKEPPGEDVPVTGQPEVTTAAAKPGEDVPVENAANTGDVPVPDEPAPDEPAPDGPAPDEPAADEQASDEPATDEPVTDEPAPDEPAPHQPAPDEPVSDEPMPDEPASDEPAPNQPT